MPAVSRHSISGCFFLKLVAKFLAASPIILILLYDFLFLLCFQKCDEEKF